MVALVAGTVLHVFAPLRLFSVSWPGHALRWPLLAAGLLGAGWAVWAIEDTDIASPTKLISRGSYALSRHPIYVAWTLICLVISLAANAL
jgi:protein-S-isoprenylcysteine O-methyltransferase Ste14